jgi:hypothetical protein
MFKMFTQICTIVIYLFWVWTFDNHQPSVATPSALRTQEVEDEDEMRPFVVVAVASDVVAVNITTLVVAAVLVIAEPRLVLFGLFSGRWVAFED